jgi:hypothetical protein
MKKKLLFIGHFSDVDCIDNIANSPAGNIVQKEILLSCETIMGIDSVDFVSQIPIPVWPKGPFFVKSSKLKNGEFPGFINFPFLKSLCFSFSVFKLLILNHKYTTVLQYNSYLFDNLIVLLSKTRALMIIQDVRLGESFSYLNRFCDYISTKLLKHYEIVVPVNELMGKLLGIEASKTIIFPGGLTSFSSDIKSEEDKLEGFVTFAGALEPYNGIKVLLNKWRNLNIKIPIHIFGKGSLQQSVIDAANTNPLIIYHGNSSQEKVKQYQSVAKFNLCLRYSDGIREEYFYPSKFFNVAMCPGLAIYNDFYGLPPSYKEMKGFIEHDLNNIDHILKLTDVDIIESSKERIKFTKANFSWEKLVKKILE